MERSESIDQLAAALAQAQGEFQAAEKSRSNPAFRSKYATLEDVWTACRPALQKHGLSVAQFPEPCEAGFLCLTTMLLHSSGQYLSGSLLMPLAKQDPQGYGSALTYARRYGLAAALGIVADEDDDANAASGRSEDRRDNRPERQEASRQQRPESRGDAAANGKPAEAADLKPLQEAVAKAYRERYGKPEAAEQFWKHLSGILKRQIHSFAGVPETDLRRVLTTLEAEARQVLGEGA